MGGKIGLLKLSRDDLKKKFWILIPSLWAVIVKNSLKTQKYENHLNDILGCLINQFLHELNDMNLFLQCNKLKN